MFHDKESHVGSNLFFEKLMRDECEKILLNNNQGRKTKKLYREWNPDLHSKTGNEFRFLNNIFTDESVGEIMLSY